MVSGIPLVEKWKKSFFSSGASGATWPHIHKTIFFFATRKVFRFGADTTSPLPPHHYQSCFVFCKKKHSFCFLHFLYSIFISCFWIVRFFSFLLVWKYKCRINKVVNLYWSIQLTFLPSFLIISFESWKIWIHFFLFWIKNNGYLCNCNSNIIPNKTFKIISINSLLYNAFWQRSHYVPHKISN